MHAQNKHEAKITSLKQNMISIENILDKRFDCLENKIQSKVKLILMPSFIKVNGGIINSKMHEDSNFVIQLPTSFSSY